jgi:hypothetical protein
MGAETITEFHSSRSSAGPATQSDLKSVGYDLERDASKGGLWVPYRICRALVRVGLDASVEPCLERIRAVPKVAFKVYQTATAPSHG